MKFVAIDVETANSDHASICQIGIVKSENGVLTDEWVSYVDPESRFSRRNIRLHGIDERAVCGAPTVAELQAVLHDHLNGQIVVSHSPFDRIALRKVAARYQLKKPEMTWLDSLRVARRTWAKGAVESYKLPDLCKMLGYEFVHHDALEDAKAAAHVLHKAIDQSGVDLQTWISRVNLPISACCDNAKSHQPGTLDLTHTDIGELMVFTGALEMRRAEAMRQAMSFGYQVAKSVTKKTTMVVVGDQDLNRLEGHERSSKHRKAEKLIAKGVPIRILGESDFKELIGSSRRISD